MSELVFANSEYGDYYGLYLDGILIYQEDSIPKHVLIDILNKNSVTSAREVECCGNQLDETGGFPRFLKDVRANV